MTIFDVPEISVTRGGIRFPTPAVASAEFTPLPSTAAVQSGGWCMPSVDLRKEPEGDYPPVVPCEGTHRWERWSSGPACGCPQCESDVQHWLECGGCSETIQQGASAFDELWEVAPWV